MTPFVLILPLCIINRKFQVSGRQLEVYIVNLYTSWYKRKPLHYYYTRKGLNWRQIMPQN